MVRKVNWKKKLLKNKSGMFFVSFKFGFHTWNKQFQGGPLAVRLSTFAFKDGELVNGYKHNEKCERFIKHLEESGWNESYLEKIITKILSGKVKLYPLLVTIFNIQFKR